MEGGGGERGREEICWEGEREGWRKGGREEWRNGGMEESMINGDIIMYLCIVC